MDEIEEAFGEEERAGNSEDEDEEKERGRGRGDGGTRGGGREEIWRR